MITNSSFVPAKFRMERDDVESALDQTWLCTSAEVQGLTGKYFDNDRRQFASPHPDALDAAKNAQLVSAVESLLKEMNS